MKITEVNPTIFRGSAPKHYYDINELRIKGIRSIISLETGLGGLFGYNLESLEAAICGIQVVRLPESNIFSPSKTQVKNLLWLLSVLPKPIFIHCYAGVDRTGFMIGVYRVKIQGWSMEMAWEECLRQGFPKYRYFWWKREFFKICKWLA